MAVNYDKLVRLLKKEPELGHTAAAAEMEVSIGQMSMLEFCRAQVEAGIWGKLPKTAKSVKTARVTDENRWELIAARIGGTVKEAKELAEDAGLDLSTSSTGRGRPVGNGNGSSSKSGSTSKRSGVKVVASKSSSKKSAAKKTSARRGRPPKTAPARARTLAERRSRANPS